MERSDAEKRRQAIISKMRQDAQVFSESGSPLLEGIGDTVSLLVDDIRVSRAMLSFLEKSPRDLRERDWIKRISVQKKVADEDRCRLMLLPDQYVVLYRPGNQEHLLSEIIAGSTLKPFNDIIPNLMGLAVTNENGVASAQPIIFGNNAEDLKVDLYGIIPQEPRLKPLINRINKIVNTGNIHIPQFTSTITEGYVINRGVSE